MCLESETLRAVQSEREDVFVSHNSSSVLSSVRLFFHANLFIN